ncbi:MAG: hypothetical protein BWZ07_00199 [Alphaproteobacteria bacterium ADurb.BinA280]|jgi:hypothetical protein|nr:MAG: hypothetical protein BWZ07_00199 [Alphaproteobacteria bacterium ADurb.BinA280]
MPVSTAFEIVRRRPDSVRRQFLRWLLAAAALVLSYALGAGWLWPDALGGPGVAELEAQIVSLNEELSNARQRNTLLKRSDDVSHAANQQLQQDIESRDERIAALEADVSFYERLVGGSAQRQGLAVHSLNVSSAGQAAYRYQLTLTQNLKKTQLSRGMMRLSIEGMSGGKLTTLDWDALLDTPQAPPAPFEFKYFQQIEGSFTLPADFTPLRVLVRTEGEAGKLERSINWEDAVAGPESPGAVSAPTQP